MLKGISMYKEKAEVGQRYDSVVEPYRGMLAAENIDPVQLFQSFSANHYLLSRGTPEQKVQLAASIISGYGLDLQAINDFIGEQNYEAPDPAIEALRREIAELKSGVNSRTQADTEAAQTRILSEIEAFAADPAHPHFDELSNDIAKLMDAGYATSLNDAYDKAVFANPVTRQKELDRLSAEKISAAAAEAKTRKDKIARSTGDHVTTDPSNRNGTVLVGSMDDTLDATLRAIQDRG